MTIQVLLFGEELGGSDVFHIVTDAATQSRQQKMDRRCTVGREHLLAASHLLSGTTGPAFKLLLASRLSRPIPTASGCWAGS